MSGRNLVLLLGNLGDAPELRYTQTGKPVARLRIATSDSIDDGRGGRVDRTEWHNVVAWGGTAEACAKHLVRGQRVDVEGRLQTREFKGEDGNRRWATEVVARRVTFLDRPGRGQS